MKKYLIANFGEIFLKGDNISFFEQKLLNNFLVKAEKLRDKFEITKKRGGAFYLKLSENISEAEIKELTEIIKNTPGFSTYYLAWACASNLAEISQTCQKIALNFIKNKKIKTFGLATEKVEKTAKVKSQQVNVEVGSVVYQILEKELGEIKVNLNQPDLLLNIKIKKEQSYIFITKKRAVGGLPVGSSGKALALFSGGIDSPVAAFLGMKRGLEIIAVHFHSVPRTSPESIEKVKELVEQLSNYQFKIKLYLIPIIPLQQNIVKNTEKKLSIILQRRLFLKIALQIAKKEKIKIPAIITGDSLGQVASQTLENLTAVSEAMNSEEGIILRPLISYDKKEIIDLARKINTLEISERPHDDTCSLFIPKNPETKADLEKVKKEEEKLDKNLIADVLAKMEVLEVKK